MNTVKTQVNAREANVRVQVVRCRCGNPLKVHPGAVCPLGERVDYGQVSYTHRNPVRTGLFLIRRKLFELTHPELYRQ